MAKWIDAFDRRYDTSLCDEETVVFEGNHIM